MGNWRTVWIVGKCGAEDLPALQQAVRVNSDSDDDWDKFHPLCFSGLSLCGLGDWPAEVINVVGNLAERDFSVEQVVETLESLVKAAPSLEAKIHCGGDWESKDCIATVQAANGKVILLEPEVETIPGFSEAQMIGRFMQIITQGKE